MLAGIFSAVGSRFRIRFPRSPLNKVPQGRLDCRQAHSDGREYRRQVLELADLLCNRRQRSRLFAQDLVQPAIKEAGGYFLPTLANALGVGRPLKFARGCLDQRIG